MRSHEPWAWTPLKPPPLPEPPPSYVPATELPAGHRQVLLKLRRGDLAAKIMDHLREQGIPEPQKSDWVAAIERGHVLRDGTTLKLTPPGAWAAGDIMRDLARKFGIHHVTHHHAVTKGPWCSCSCGWRAHTGKTRSAEFTLLAFVADHLRRFNGEASSP